MNNIDLFLNKYREIETFIKEKYDMDIVDYFEKTNQKYLKDNSYLIDSIRRLRNTLTHYKSDKFDLAIPTDDCINKLNEIYKYLTNPPTVNKYMIHLNNLLFALKSDNVYSYISKMQSKGFTSIPILENSRVIGIFNLSSITSIALLNADIKINNKTIFNDILDYLKIDNQMFYEYVFIKSNLSIDDLYKIVKDRYHINKKIQLFLITENGRPTDKLIGVLSINDIINKRI